MFSIFSTLCDIFRSWNSTARSLIDRLVNYLGAPTMEEVTIDCSGEEDRLDAPLLSRHPQREFSQTPRAIPRTPTAPTEVPETNCIPTLATPSLNTSIAKAGGKLRPISATSTLSPESSVAVHLLPVARSKRVDDERVETVPKYLTVQEHVARLDAKRFIKVLRPLSTNHNKEEECMEVKALPLPDQKPLTVRERILLLERSRL
jgi:hypothetical protein